MVVWNKSSIHRRTRQSSNPRPHSVKNGTIVCIEQLESSSYRNHQENQSNPSVLPFLDMHTLEGASCIPPLTTRQGLEVTDKDNPLAKQMKRIIQTNVASTSIVELQNLSLEVESELQTNYGNNANVEGDDEHEDNDGNVCEEALNDPNIRI